MDGFRVRRMGAKRVGLGACEKVERIAVWRAGRAAVSWDGWGVGRVAGWRAERAVAMRVGAWAGVMAARMAARSVDQVAAGGVRWRACVKAGRRVNLTVDCRVEGVTVPRVGSGAGWMAAKALTQRAD